MSKYLFILLACGPFICLAQKEDNNWIMCAANYTQDTFKINHIQFTNDTFQVSLISKSIPIFGALGIVSDSIGNLMCYTNDIRIYNANHQIVENGDNFQSITQFPFGYPFDQSAIILPLADTQGVYIMIDGGQKDIGTDIITEKLRYSIIDMNENNGSGKVTEKKITVENTTDTLNIGMLTAIRHGNGKDWWVISTKYESKLHRKYLVTKDGISFYNNQVIGDTVYNGVGYAAYSPSGEWFARYMVYGKTSNPKTAFYLYRFNRCTGQLSAPLRKKFTPPEYYGGVAFSANSRFIYVAKYTKLYQYDLESADILASEKLVAQYDGFLDEKGVPTRFFGLLLALDNKIYGIIPGFNCRYLHVIDQPDLPGDSCNVIQHAVYLPADNFGTLPNVPFYRLYATEVPCDSMVSTAAPKPPAPTGIRVWPVPVADVLYFSSDGYAGEAFDLQIFDAFGRLALRVPGIRLAPACTVRLETLAPGVYFYVLRKAGGKIVKTGRVVKTG